MSSWYLIVALVVLTAGCDGSGRLSGLKLEDDSGMGDVEAVDTASSDRTLEDAPRPRGPAVSEVVPLPLADSGPAFWMVAEDREDGLLGVVVRARSLTNLVGFASQVTWDPDLLGLVEAAATAPLGGPDAVARGIAAGLGPGRLTLGVTRFPEEVEPWNPQPVGVDLPVAVEMGRFLLRPLAQGDAVIRFREGRRLARRSDYSEIPCAWVGLQVRIEGGGRGPAEGAL